MNVLSSLIAIVLGTVLFILIVASILVGPVLIGWLILRFFVNAQKRSLGILMGLVPIVVLFLGIQWRMSVDINDCYDQMRRGIAVGLCGEWEMVFRCLVSIYSSIQAFVFLIIARGMKPSNKQQITTN